MKESPTPPAVKLWINTTFHDNVREVCESEAVAAFVDAGRKQGANSTQLLSNVVAYVVLLIAKMPIDEFEGVHD